MKRTGSIKINIIQMLQHSDTLALLLLLLPVLPRAIFHLLRVLPARLGARVCAKRKRTAESRKEGRKNGSQPGSDTHERAVVGGGGSR